MHLKKLLVAFTFFVIISCIFSGCKSDKPALSPSPQATESPVEYVEGEKYFEDGYYFEVIEDAVKIVGHQDNGETEIVIPEEIAGRKVKILASDAFYQHKTVESIVLPETLTALEGSPFYRCYSLKEIYIPKNVCLITSNPFFRCSSLTEISVAPENIYYSSVDGVLYNRAKTELIAYPEGKTEEAFIIPDSVNTVCDSAFGYHAQFKTLTIPKYLTSFPLYNMFVFPEDYTLIVEDGSVAKGYAEEYGLKYEIR